MAGREVGLVLRHPKRLPAVPVLILLILSFVQHGNQRLVAAAITEKKWTMVTGCNEPAKDSILDAGLKACNVEVVRAALDQLNKGLLLWEVIFICSFEGENLW